MAKKTSGNRLPVMIAAGLLGLLALNMSKGGAPVTSTTEVAKTTRTAEPAPEPARVVAPTAFMHMRSFTGPYMQHHSRHQDQFWLFGNEDVETQMHVVHAFTRRTRGLMEETKDADPRAAELWDLFDDFYVTQFHNGTSFRTFAGEPDPFEERGLEVSTVPFIQLQRYPHMFPSLLYYRKSWGAVMVVGIEVPDAFLPALMFHEMWHAKKHRDGAESATAHPASDSFIWEEIEAHEIELNVMDAVTDGKVRALFEDIRSRALKPDDPESVALAVDHADFVEYDRITGVTNAGKAMAGVYLAQFWIGLGIHTIGDDALTGKSRKIGWFRYFKTGASKNHVALSQ